MLWLGSVAGEYGWRLKPRFLGLRATKPACAGWVRYGRVA